tara:strand:- start:118 stop:1671 length:1554 start_codon:yes stop_codon:yes gene_type:complete
MGMVASMTMGAGIGGVLAGPLGAILGLATIPGMRFVKGAVISSIDPKILPKIGVTRVAGQVRSSEFGLGGSGQVEGALELIAGEELWSTLHGPGAAKFFRAIVKQLDNEGFTPLDFAENVLRGTSFSVALDLAARMGLEGNRAQMFAVRVVDRSMYTYDEFSRNAWFRSNFFGALIAPLTSFPTKKAAFIRRMLTENASDGASPEIATLRYLFLNGLVSSMVRETTKELMGEEYVPRQLQERVAMPFPISAIPSLQGMTVKAPAGFFDISQFAPDRAPGVAAADALWKVVTGSDDSEKALSIFTKYFVPYGLLVDDTLRTYQRMRGGAVPGEAGIRQGEGTVAQISRGGSHGAFVRPTSPTREGMRWVGWVSPEETERQALENRARAASREEAGEDRKLRENIDLLVRNYRRGELNSQQIRAELMQMQETPAGKRLIAKGGIRQADMDNLQRGSLRRAWDDNIKWKKELAAAQANGVVGTYQIAQELGMSWQDLLDLTEVYKLLRQEMLVKQMIGEY